MISYYMVTGKSVDIVIEKEVTDKEIGDMIFTLTNLSENSRSVVMNFRI